MDCAVGPGLTKCVDQPEDIRESMRSDAEEIIKDRTAQTDTAWQIARDEELMEFRIRAAREEELESKNGKLEKEKADGQRCFNAHLGGINQGRWKRREDDERVTRTGVGLRRA